ncbi:hypothetical protein F0T03_12125 [Yersinia canariae]|uniref:Uncharacterized protein n=1 Tax=Yersinia canariae TaxID=2607663 RepID=A0A857EZI7_9GAMM|nr:hypothetical protein [Yersinia canariae]QHB32843.1 hypothetical protein F0T03_12125 [Yersinia canariae]
MKNRMLVPVLAGLFCTSTMATKVEGDTLIYQKSDGEIRLSAVPNNDQQAMFSIKTNVGMHACNVKGIASVVANTKDHTTLQWQEGQCKVTLKWGQASVKVTADEECNSYCGMNAGNSLSGTYK